MPQLDTEIDRILDEIWQHRFDTIGGWYSPSFSPLIPNTTTQNNRTLHKLCQSIYTVAIFSLKYHDTHITFKIKHDITNNFLYVVFIP